jgi:hypothetical protein
MLKHLGLLCLAACLGACASNPHKAKDIKTEMERNDTVSGDTKLGVKDGNLVVQKKVLMNEDLRRLQNEVYSLEDRVYGNRDYKSEGMYGALKKCRGQLSSKKLGGDGKLIWTEPMDRVTDKEDDFEIGIDEKDKIVGVSEEFLLDRIKRFKGYKQVLMKREDEYKDKLEICDTELDARTHDLEEKEKKQKRSEAKNSSDTSSDETAE